MSYTGPTANLGGIGNFALRLGQLRNKRENGTPLPEERSELGSGVRPEDAGLHRLAITMGENRIARGDSDTAELSPQALKPEHAGKDPLEDSVIRLAELRNKRNNGVPLPEEREEPLPAGIRAKDIGLHHLAVSIGENSIARAETAIKAEQPAPEQSTSKDSWGPAGPWGIDIPN